MTQEKSDNAQDNANAATQQKLPKAEIIIGLGIGSIILSCCCVLVALIPAVVGLVLASGDEKLYNENPSLYSNYSNLKTGKILCFVGIGCSVMMLIISLIFGMADTFFLLNSLY
jgi:uncharacterized membrane protein